MTEHEEVINKTLNGYGRVKALPSKKTVRIVNIDIPASYLSAYCEQRIMQIVKRNTKKKDGLLDVPKTGVYLLESGERVTTAKTSAKMDKILEDTRGPSIV